MRAILGILCAFGITQSVFADETIEITTAMSYGRCQVDDAGVPESCEVTVDETKTTSFAMKKSAEDEISQATVEVTMEEGEFKYLGILELSMMTDEKNVPLYWLSPTMQILVGPEKVKELDDKVAIVSFEAPSQLNDILFFSPVLKKDKVLHFVGLNVSAVKAVPPTMQTMVEQIQHTRPEFKKAKIIVNKSVEKRLR